MSRTSFGEALFALNGHTFLHKHQQHVITRLELERPHAIDRPHGSRPHYKEVAASTKGAT